MLQTVATITSLLLAVGAIAIITASIADDWDALRAALGLDVVGKTAPLPPHFRAKAARRARVLRVSPRTVSQRAAA